MGDKAPEHIDLVYRRVGDSHVFASKGIRGLVHVSDVDLNIAIRKAISALNYHVTETYGAKATYVCDSSVCDLDSAVATGSMRVVGAHLDPAGAPCH